MPQKRPQEYGFVSKLLHWAIALLIFGLIALGWWMVGLNFYHRWYHASLSWHKSLGMLVLALAIFKLAWRGISAHPDLPAGLSGWQRTAARHTHRALFALMFLIPLTGYVISTSAGQGIPMWGLFEIPALWLKNEALRDAAIKLHYWLAYGAGGLAALHALAALKHQFIDRDGTLRRML